MLVHFYCDDCFENKISFTQKFHLEIWFGKGKKLESLPPFLLFGLLAQLSRAPLPFFLGRGPAGPLPPLLPSHPLTGQACLSAPSSPSRRACEAGFNAFEKMKRIFFYCASGKFGEVAECFLREKHSPNAVLREIGPSIERCTRRALCVR